jgi:hypothetical protein
MSEIIGQVVKFMSNNQIVATIVSVAILGLIGWCFKCYRDRRDSKKICEFLLQSLRTTGFKFRSTHVISSATRIPESRVAELCSKHRKIKRNEREKESWQLVQ